MEKNKTFERKNTEKLKHKLEKTECQNGIFSNLSHPDAAEFDKDWLQKIVEVTFSVENLPSSCLVGTPLRLEFTELSDSYESEMRRAKTLEDSFDQVIPIPNMSTMVEGI